MHVSYRQIAKLLAKGMLLDGQDYSTMIEGSIKSIEAMPLERQAALSAAYIFSCKVPKEERQDLFQDLVAHTLTELTKYDGRIKDIEGFCYTVAKHKWGDWWKQKKRRKRILNGSFVSLNEPVIDSENQEVELQELLTGKLEWTTIRPTNLESELNSKLDCQAVLDTLPDEVKAIVEKRIDYKKQNRGCKVSSSECNILHRYIKQNGHKIREALKA